MPRKRRPRKQPPSTTSRTRTHICAPFHSKRRRPTEIRSYLYVILRIHIDYIAPSTLLGKSCTQTDSALRHTVPICRIASPARGRGGDASSLSSSSSSSSSRGFEPEPLFATRRVMSETEVCDNQPTTAAVVFGGGGGIGRGFIVYNTTVVPPGNETTR